MKDFVNEQTQQTLEAIRRLSRVMIHDLNNPLSALSGYLQLSRMRLTRLQQGDHSAVPDLVEFLDKMDQATERIGSLVQRLDRFSKITPAPAQPVHLDKMWERLVAIRDNEERQRITVETMEPALTIRTHPQCFELICDELLDNACWATRESSDARITIQNHKEEDSHFLLEVEDTGCGIEPEMLEQLVLPCYFNREGKGFPKQGLLVGIGLPIVYQVTRYLGGTMQIESPADGAATRVKVHLPIE